MRSSRIAKMLPMFQKQFQTRLHECMNWVRSTSTPQTFVPNSNSIFLDFPSTELPEIVGWGDPDQRRLHNGMRFRGTPYFSISMSNEAAKIRILEQIRNLNGRICENLQSYDKMCSHLLCDRPNRGEKTCCSIASGKWVLSTEYVQKSIENGRFLDVSIDMGHRPLKRKE